MPEEKPEESAPKLGRQDLSAFDGAACVVTGGLGFIGSNLAVQLAAAGARVRVVDALVPGHGGDLRNIAEPGAAPGSGDTRGVAIEVTLADIGDDAAVSDALVGADFIFNLAGQVSHVDSMSDPVRDLDLNARSHFAFLELARSLNPEAVVVYTSTRQVYGRPQYLPVDEEHPVQLVDVNAISKYAAEQLHILYSSVYGMRACALRLSNVYGPRQMLLGGSHGFLPIFIRRALSGETITVYGDGRQRRDCTHVDDVVAALAAAALSPEAVGKVFNVGHPEALELRHIAESIVAAAGSGEVVLTPWPENRASIDIGSYEVDISRAKRVLSWEPQIDFDSGIADTIEFYERRREWYL